MFLTQFLLPHNLIFVPMEALTIQPRLVLVNLYIIQMIDFHFRKLYLVPSFIFRKTVP